MGSVGTSFIKVDWELLYGDTHIDLSGMDEEFSLAEIQIAIFSLSADRFLDPDGFTMAFYQEFWEIVIWYILWLFNDLFFSKAEIGRINYAHIVLVAKVGGANKVGQFRPISLLNCSFKIISKILANRLGKVIDQLVDQAQFH